MRFDESFVKQVLPDVSMLYGALSFEPNFSIDTRLIKPNQLFVALPGVHVDGHNFIQDALKKDAAGIIISRHKRSALDAIDTQLLEKKIVLTVEDTHDALLKLAAAWRRKFSYPVVGITGSVGKTSTKETLRMILQESGKNHLVSQEKILIALSAS